MKERQILWMLSVLPAVTALLTILLFYVLQAA